MLSSFSLPININDRMAIYKKAINTKKEISNAFFHRGNIYSILNKHDLAIKDYKEALKKNNTCFAKSYILEKIEKQYIDKFKN